MTSNTEYICLLVGLLEYALCHLLACERQDITWWFVRLGNKLESMEYTILLAVTTVVEEGGGHENERSLSPSMSCASASDRRGSVVLTSSKPSGEARSLAAVAASAGSPAPVTVASPRSRDSRLLCICRWQSI